MSYGTQTLLKCAFLLLFGSHWFACIIALQASLHSNVDETWVGEDRYMLCAQAPMTWGDLALDAKPTDPAEIDETTSHQQIKQPPTDGQTYPSNYHR